MSENNKVNGDELADRTFKGKSPKYNLRVAEYIRNRLNAAIPATFEASIYDDGKVWIAMEDFGRVEIRPHGADIFSVIFWGGQPANETMLKRYPNIPCKDVIGLVGGALKSFDELQGSETYNRNEEDGAQDTTLAPSTSRDPEHYSTSSGWSSNKETGQTPEYLKSMKTDKQNSTPASRYDVTGQKAVKTEKMPSAGRELQKHNDGEEFPDKKVMKPSSNVVYLEEGQKIRKVAGMGYLITGSDGKVQFLAEGTQIVQKKKQWSRDPRTGEALLFEVVQNLK